MKQYLNEDHCTTRWYWQYSRKLAGPSQAILNWKKGNYMTNLKTRNNSKNHIQHKCICNKLCWNIIKSILWGVGSSTSFFIEHNRLSNLRGQMPSLTIVFRRTCEFYQPPNWRGRRPSFITLQTWEAKGRS